MRAPRKLRTWKARGRSRGGPSSLNSATKSEIRSPSARVRGGGLGVAAIRLLFTKKRDAEKMVRKSSRTRSDFVRTVVRLLFVCPKNQN